MSTKEVDGDLVFDKVLRAEIEDPNTPKDRRELAKKLLSLSPYEEKKRKKKGKK
jgi:hypothetical protein